MRQILKFWFTDVIWNGCGAKNLALLQNQCKPSQLGKLINLINGKWHTKVRIIVSNCRNIIFAPQPGKELRAIHIYRTFGTLFISSLRIVFLLVDHMQIIVPSLNIYTQ